MASSAPRNLTDFHKFHNYTTTVCENAIQNFTENSANGLAADFAHPVTCIAYWGLHRVWWVIKRADRSGADSSEANCEMYCKVTHVFASSHLF
jgi:hypothetical protein